MHSTVEDSEGHVRHVTQALRGSPVWDLVVATARLERGRRAVEGRARLGTADLRLIWLLVEKGPRTMKEISEELGLEQSTVNRQVNAALKAGYLERLEPAGRGARTLTPTDEGYDLFASDMHLVIAVLDEGLSAVPVAEARRFMENLLTFSEAYGRAAEQR
jgi:DNA-binding MarR family transcriptional regulator